MNPTCRGVAVLVLSLLTTSAGCAGVSKPPVLPACLAFMVPVAALSGTSAVALSAMCAGGTAVYAYDHR